MSNLLFVEKYRPRSLEEFIGNKKQLMQVMELCKNYKKGKGILLYGPPGTGKTETAYLVAKLLGYQIIETNASDSRNIEDIKKMISSVGKQRTLFATKHIILMDEVDGLDPSRDKGAIKEIINLISISPYPVILTSNDAYNKRLRNLLPYVVLIKYNKLSSRDIVIRLREIASKEGINIEEKAIRFIADHSNGDMRAALNDLQVLSSKKEVTYDDALNSLGYREYEKEVFDVLPVIFKTMSLNTALTVASQSTLDFDMLFEWIRENISIEYKLKEDIDRAYYWLSISDIYRGRIRRQQYWRYLYYAQQLLVGGVALAKKEKYPGFTKYQYPKKIKILSSGKQQRAIDKEKMKEISIQLHVSTKKIREEYKLLIDKIDNLI